MRYPQIHDKVDDWRPHYHLLVGLRLAIPYIWVFVLAVALTLSAVAFGRSWELGVLASGFFVLLGALCYLAGYAVKVWRS